MSPTPSINPVAAAPRRSIAGTLRSLTALLVLVALVAGVPVLLIALGAYPQSVPSSSDVVRALTHRDTGPVIQAVLTVLVWATWAVFVTATIRETVAAVRSRGAATAPPVPGFAAASVPASALVHAALALVFVTPVLLTASAAPGAAHTTTASSAAPAGTVSTSSMSTSSTSSMSSSPVSRSSMGAAAAGRSTPPAPQTSTPAGQAAHASPGAPARGHPTVTVRRHDTLWRLAEVHLGDPMRWTEIRSLNAGILHGGTTIRAGHQLRLPRDARGGDAAQSLTRHTRYTVRPGDTLSQIAEDRLGGAGRYPQIFEASRGIVQPGGRRLSDPDLILAGWQLAIPAALIATAPADDAAAPPPRAAASPEPQTEPQTEPESVSPSTVPTTSSGAATPSAPAGTPAAGTAAAGWPGWPTGSGRDASVPPTPPPASPTSPPVSPPSSPTGSPRPAGSSDDASVGTSRAADHHGGGETGEGVLPAAWRVAALTGAGGVLAGAVSLAVRRRRRLQQRHRRPGRVPALPGGELGPVEKTVRTVGALTAPTVSRLDLLLRSVAAEHAGAGIGQPRLAAVELAQDGIVLHLAAPADLAAAAAGRGRHREGEGATTAARWQRLDESGRVWRAAADAVDGAVHGAGTPPGAGQVAAEEPAPYPLLVTVGLDPACGSVWMVNLEDHAVCVSPAPGAGDAGAGPGEVARYLAAELACHPWASGVQADCVALGPEVGLLNPDRVQTHQGSGDADQDDPLGPAAIVLAAAVAMIDRAAAAGTDVVSARVSGAGDETWPARVLILGQDQTAPDSPGPPPILATITDLLGRHPGGTGTGVVLVGGAAGGGRSADADGVWVEVAMTVAGGAALRHRDVHDGRAIQLTPVAMSAQEARGCALLLAQSEVIDDVAVPRPDPAPDPAGGEQPGEEATDARAAVGAQAWTAWTDTAGGLRPEHTLPRAGIVRGPGGVCATDPSARSLRTPRRRTCRTPSPTAPPAAAARLCPPAMPRVPRRRHRSTGPVTPPRRTGRTRRPVRRRAVTPAEAAPMSGSRRPRNRRAGRSCPLPTSSTRRPRRPRRRICRPWPRGYRRRSPRGSGQPTPGWMRTSRHGSRRTARCRG